MAFRLKCWKLWHIRTWPIPRGPFSHHHLRRTGCPHLIYIISIVSLFFLNQLQFCMLFLPACNFLNFVRYSFSFSVITQCEINWPFELCLLNQFSWSLDELCCSLQLRFLCDWFKFAIWKKTRRFVDYSFVAQCFNR